MKDSTRARLDAETAAADLPPLSRADTLEAIDRIREELTALRLENLELKNGIRNAAPVIVTDIAKARALMPHSEPPPPTATEAERRRQIILRAMDVRDIRKILRSAYGDNYYWDKLGSRAFVIANWDKLESAVVDWIRGAFFHG